MRDPSVERVPLTLRELEAEQEMIANWQPLKGLPKSILARYPMHRRIRVEQFPLTPREQEAEAEQEKQELGMALPF